MKKLTKLVSIILAVMVLFVSFPIQTEAATVKLNKTKATIYVGKTTTLKIKGTSKKVTWKSSNKNVASVTQKGKVTAKKAGTATITAKVGKKSYKCKVTVKKPYINTTKKTINKGKSFTLKLTGTSIKSVKSSNAKVASVTKKGKVTGKKAGKATITLTGKDGKKYTCKVTVKETETPIVEKVGTVDDDTYKKAVSAFEDIVKRMRADGLVQAKDVCVTLDGSTIKVDITSDDSDVDITLSQNATTKEYILALDYNFTWLEDFGPTVNGKDPAAYNKELLIATLSMISDAPETVFNRIDLDCFSAAGLSYTEWEEVGDCFIKCDDFVLDKYFSYNIKK